MKEGFIAAVISFCSLAAVVVVVAGSVYGCQTARTAYYSAQKDCVQSGGTWLPFHGDTAACVGAKP